MARCCRASALLRRREPVPASSFHRTAWRSIPAETSTWVRCATPRGIPISPTRRGHGEYERCTSTNGCTRLTEPWHCMRSGVDIMQLWRTYFPFPVALPHKEPAACVGLGGRVVPRRALEHGPAEPAGAVHDLVEQLAAALGRIRGPEHVNIH